MSKNEDTSTAESGAQTDDEETTTGASMPAPRDGAPGASDESQSDGGSRSETETETVPETVFGRFDADDVEQAARSADDAAAAVIDGADAESEAASERDGAFSWKGESHAFVIGLGSGFAAAAYGDMTLLSAVVGAGTGAMYGNRGLSTLSPGFQAQVKKELPYAAAGLVLGALFAQLLTGESVNLSAVRELVRGVTGA